MYNCLLRITSGFHHKVEQNCTLLGYYAASSGNLLLAFQDNLSVPSLRVKIPEVKMEPICCPKMLVRNYNYMLHSDREKSSFQQLHSVQNSGCHHMSQFEYKCCINMCQIIKHYYACADVLQDCSDV